jgi:hypothetical protein
MAARRFGQTADQGRPGTVEHGGGAAGVLEDARGVVSAEQERARVGEGTKRGRRVRSLPGAQPHLPVGVHGQLGAVTVHVGSAAHPGGREGLSTATVSIGWGKDHDVMP